MIAATLIACLCIAAGIGLLVRLTPAWSRMVAIASSAFIAIVATSAMMRNDHAEINAPLPGLDVPGLSIPLNLVTSKPLAAIGFVVALVTFAVQVYAAWYLATDDRYGVFAATVSLFSAAMLLVVFGGDLVLMLIGWEVMGWCSYLLIGHWSRRAAARRAAYKAFLVTRIADVGFVLAVVGLSTGAGSSALEAVVAHWSGPDADSRLRSALLILLVLGVLGKSASFPFQDWLPDAMEGPTPASALIHAATMVAAGTVVLSHVFTLLTLAPAARWVLGISSAVTMLGAAILAFGQPDLKRLLAWSTVSQVAIMLSALATSPASAGPDAGLFHLWSHAVFKSLLFLALGWLAAIVGGTTASALRGAFHDAPTPILVWGTIFGFASLMGVPLLVGGLSKEHVLVEAYDSAITGGGPGLIVLCALLLTIVVTAAYCTRAYLVLTAPLEDLEAEPVGESAPANRGVHAVIAGLSVLSVVGGLALLSNVFHVEHASLIWTLITVALIAAGVVTAVVARGDSDPAQRLLGPAMLRFAGGFGADTAYRALVSPITRLAHVVAFLDREAIDGYVRSAALTTRVSGAIGARGHQRARVSSNLALVVLGMLALLGLGVLTWR